MGFWADFIWSWSITVTLFTAVATFVATLWWYYTKAEKKEEDEPKEPPKIVIDERDYLEELEDGVLKDIRDDVLCKRYTGRPEAVHDKALIIARYRTWDTCDTSKIRLMLLAFEEKELSVLVKSTEALSLYMKENSQSKKLSEIISLHTLSVMYTVALGEYFTDVYDDQLVSIKNELDAIIKLWPDYNADNPPPIDPESKLTAAIDPFLDRMYETLEEFQQKGSLSYQKTLLEQASVYQNDNEVIEFLLMFFLYGYPAIVKFISSSMALLAEHPDVQENALKNLEGDISDISFEEKSFIEKYPLIEATFQEILRITKIVPFAGRRTITPNKDVKLLPIHTYSKIDLTKALDDNQYWEAPEKFNPSRFLDDNGQFVKQKACIPFSIGVKTCPGKKLVQLIGRVFLTSVIKNCFLSKLKPSPDADEENADPTVPVKVEEQKKE